MFPLLLFQARSPFAGVYGSPLGSPPPAHMTGMIFVLKFCNKSYSTLLNPLTYTNKTYGLPS